jgi:hypothetical protein
VSKNCHNDAKTLSKRCQQFVRKLSNIGPNFVTLGRVRWRGRRRLVAPRKIIKIVTKKNIYRYIKNENKLSKSCKKVVKKLQKLQKLLGKSCQKVVKRLSKFC